MNTAESGADLTTLMDQLHQEDALRREQTARALGRLGMQAVAPLLQLLESDAAPLVRVAAVDALALLGDDRALQGVVTALSDADLRVQIHAAWAVPRFGAATVDPVIAVLRDHGAAGRVWAAVALGRLEDRRAVAPLLAARHDPDSAVRAAVVGALGHFEGPGSEEVLIAALDDADGVVRRAAATGLAQVGTANAVTPLIAHLGDPSRDVGTAAATALGALGDARAVEPLIRWLQQRDERAAPSYREIAVIEALGQVGDRRALAVLREVQQAMGAVETDEEPLKIADVATAAIQHITERLRTATSD